VPVAQARSCYSVLQTVGEVNDCQGLAYFGRLQCIPQLKQNGAEISDMLKAEVAHHAKGGTNA
jgi:hypothetical protein